MGKYICEVRKDDANHELELVHAKHFSLAGTSPPGAIKFKGPGDMYEYFNKHCKSEEALIKEAEAGNNLFSFLFFTLLFIFICTIVWQMCNKGSAGGGGGGGGPVTNTAFGRFSF